MDSVITQNNMQNAAILCLHHCVVCFISINQVILHKTSLAWWKCRKGNKILCFRSNCKTMWRQQHLKENNMLNSFWKAVCSVGNELTQMSW